ncbi:hypothetical protein AAG906_035290 [Vitis piasezkii]
MPQTKEVSLCASELMMLREAKLVGFFSFCAASENQPCRPSSCGDIQNISIPFRLKGDPLGCGHPDPTYELKSNCFSLPLYPLTIDDLYRYEFPAERDTVVLMNCARPIFDQYYIPIVPCNRTDATFSSSQPYAYALAGRYMHSPAIFQDQICKKSCLWGSINTLRSPYTTQVLLITGFNHAGREDAFDQSGFSGTTIAIGTALIVPSIIFHDLQIELFIIMLHIF